MLQTFTQYYGLDWLDMIMTVITIVLLGQKSKMGFVANIIGNVAGIFVGVMVSSIPLIVLNAVVMFFSFTGFLKWHRSKETLPEII